VTLLEKARESLAVARLAHDAGHYNRAASNAYFASHQAVRSELERLKIPPLDTGWTEGKRWEHKTAYKQRLSIWGCPMNWSSVSALITPCEWTLIIRHTLLTKVKPKPQWNTPSRLSVG
jgi:hypothetical protein